MDWFISIQKLLFAELFITLSVTLTQVKFLPLKEKLATPLIPAAAGLEPFEVALKASTKNPIHLYIIGIIILLIGLLITFVKRRVAI